MKKFYLLLTLGIVSTPAIKAAQAEDFNEACLTFIGRQGVLLNKYLQKLEETRLNSKNEDTRLQLASEITRYRGILELPGFEALHPQVLAEIVRDPKEYCQKPNVSLLRGFKIYNYYPRFMIEDSPDEIQRIFPPFPPRIRQETPQEALTRVMRHLERLEQMAGQYVLPVIFEN